MQRRDDGLAIGNEKLVDVDAEDFRCHGNVVKATYGLLVGYGIALA